MRFLSLLLLVVALAAPAAGCGVGEPGSGSPGGPKPQQLAWESMQAARQAGSAHFSFEATVTGEGAAASARLTVEGAFDRGRAEADVNLTAEGQSLAGTLLVDRTGFFIRYLGAWYGEVFAPREAERWQEELESQHDFSDHFGDIFEGSVTTGPAADGVPTWAYNGSLNVDGIVELAEEEGERIDEASREQLEELAESARFTLLVGKADLLPRAFRLDIRGEGANVGGFGALGTDVAMTLSGSLSGWGQPVRITPPGSYAPLEELFGQFFTF